jgi:HPt (histidine-containing phosphotransfer) domain-containing protein
VIGLTARALPGDRQRCLDAGMDDYLPKPLEPRALLDAVRRLVAADDTGEPPCKLPAGLAKNPAILEKITEHFLQDYTGNLEELRDAVDKRSSEAIDTMSHRLRGSLVVFGARDAALAASRLEDCGREGHLDDVEAAFECLEREVWRLAAYLEEIRVLRS